MLPLKDTIHLYLEIGVHEGQSMRWVMEHLQPEHAWGVDHYTAPRRRLQPEYDAARERAVRNLRPWTWTTGDPVKPHMCMLIHEQSQQWLRHINPRRHPGYDLIFCDGCHHAAPALEDFVLSWPLLRKGGIMVLDDYNRRWQMGGPRSHEAIDAFLHAYETLYEFVWREPRQIGIKKR